MKKTLLSVAVVAAALSAAAPAFAWDPAYSSRDREVERQAAKGVTGTALSTNDSGVVARPSAFDPALSTQDRIELQRASKGAAYQGGTVYIPSRDGFLTD